MGVRKDITCIKEQLSLINEKLSSEVVEKANKYDEMKENVSKIKLKVKEVTTFLDEHGSKSAKIVYEIDPVVLTMEDNGETWTKNDVFYAINILDLVSIKEMGDVTEKISKILKQNKKER